MPERDHARGVLRRQLPLEIDELAPRVGQLFRELARLHLEQPRQALHLLRRDLDVGRARRHRFHGRGDRERLVVAVDDPAARGGELDHARVARFALLLQEVVVEPLQVERAAGERREPDEQQAKQQRVRAMPEAARRAADCVTALTVSPPRLRVAPPGRAKPAAPACRATGSASFSTRACVAQVLCSSCSCPHSTSSCLASSCSFCSST